MKLSKLFLLVLLLSCTKGIEKQNMGSVQNAVMTSAGTAGTILKYCIVQGVTHRIKFKVSHIGSNDVELGVYDLSGQPLVVKPVVQSGKQIFEFTFSEGLRCDVQYILTSNGVVLSQANATCVMCN